MWSPTSTVAADGFYHITPAGGASGCWVLQAPPGGASVLQLGVVADGATSTDLALRTRSPRARPTGPGWSFRLAKYC